MNRWMYCDCSNDCEARFYEKTSSSSSLPSQSSSSLSASSLYINPTGFIPTRFVCSLPMLLNNQSHSHSNRESSLLLEIDSVFACGEAPLVLEPGLHSFVW